MVAKHDISGDCALTTDRPVDLLAQLAEYRLLIDHVADVLIRGDVNRRRLYVSPAARDMLGYEPAELLFGGALDLVHPLDKDRAAETLQKLSEAHPQLSLVFRMRRKDGSYVWVEGRYVHLPADGGVVAVLRDVTGRKNAEDLLAKANQELAAANRMLQELATTDGLTELPNRRSLDQRLALEVHRARRERQPLGVVLFDIDHFKLFNDLYGHVTGDSCLRRVSQTIAGALRRQTDFPGRYGGEELLVLLPSTDEAGTYHVAEELRKAVAGLRIEHRRTKDAIVTVSAGYVARIPTGADRPEDFISGADAGLYAAKAAGRNRTCPHSSAPGK